MPGRAALALGHGGVASLARLPLSLCWRSSALAQRAPRAERPRHASRMMPSPVAALVPDPVAGPAQATAAGGWRMAARAGPVTPARQETRTAPPPPDFRRPRPQ